ncbi:LysR substrate-binding domain-containing protein [Roseomonas sp. NAR14]|uniref:LysR substrate-binding domain-containing protein n=1 Tax=Roseomonas acroporae TaxID=2937791 RepID=A0A9X2BTZ2_9PROT|nr:LysR substrate-binding domain-containing protein [Roseomonas acroporae]MCK8785158.1 LysR substrate-binding domain-containing protein [Roseomonas acroporae]
MAHTNLAGLSLRDLEYAVAVGELRHFGRAAERCGVSQSALSEQVRKLEGLLGCPLFERTKRRVEPTPEGSRLLRQAEEVLRGARALLDAARLEAEPLSGELRIGVIPTLGPYYVPAMLRTMRERFPRLRLQLQEAATQALLDQLRHGELDLLLLALPTGGEGLLAEPLFFEPFMLACPATHPLAGATPARVRDLPGEELLLLEEGHCLRDQALSLCRAGHLDRHARQATSLEMLRHMVGAGEGYSLLPALATGHGDMGGLVAYRKLAEPAAGRRIGLVWRRSAPRESEFRLIAAHLRQHLPAAVRPCGEADQPSAA